MMRTLIKLMGLTLILNSATVMAADNTTPKVSSTPKGVVTKDADNTDLNERDKNSNTPTPQKQSNTESDVDLLAAVRRSIVNDDSLSMAAHNVKVIVEKGVVTLRGPVKNTHEKAHIEQLTRNVAGVVKVENRLDIDTK